MRKMNTPFPKIDQHRAAKNVGKKYNNSCRDIQNLQRKTRVHRAPAFTKFLVGRIYSDTSMAKAEKIKKIESRKRSKLADKAKRDMMKLQTEIEEVTRLERQVVARQAALKRKQKRKKKFAVVVIQKTYRGHLARRLVSEIKAHRAAIVVQKIFRGATKRKKFRKNIYKHRKHSPALDVIFDGSQASELIAQAQQERAAMVLQTFARVKLENIRLTKKRRNEAAVQVQKIVRARIARKNVEKITAAIARDRLASELFITQLRPSFRRIGQVGFSAISDDNKISYNRSLQSRKLSGSWRSDKFLTNKASNNAKKVLRAAKRTKLDSDSNTYGNNENERKDVSSSILDSMSTKNTANVPKKTLQKDAIFITSAPFESSTNMLDVAGSSLITESDDGNEESYADDFESEFDDLMDSVEKLQNIKAEEPFATKKEPNARNGAEYLRESDQYSSDSDVSFGSEFDSDVIGLSDLKGRQTK